MTDMIRPGSGANFGDKIGQSTQETTGMLLTSLMMTRPRTMARRPDRRTEGERYLGNQPIGFDTTPKGQRKKIF